MSMGNVVDRFKKHAPENAINRSRLNKAGCRLSKKNIPTPNVVIDLDRLEKAQDSKRADYLFASNNDGGWIVAIEMKKGAPDIQHSLEQLQSAAEIAEKWVSDEDVKNFRAVLASGSMPRANSRLLKEQSSRIRFGNELHEIRRLRCGDELRKAFD